ncbi:MAG: 50S ribosomal protein L21 [Acidimicrobiia bacterium]
MYAVIRTGGKQYKVEAGDTLQVDHLAVKGNQVTFTPVLVVTDDGKSVYGKKELRSFNVKAKVIGDAKGDKVTVLKYRPKSGYASKTGHRQLYSLIEITSIGDKGKAKQSEPEEAKEPESEETAQGSEVT